ncbi:unnamed protein product [Fusarium graminearum]|uniref:Chromosome 2, complete genome n=1 Tax=Gibberella zeae (strain ATCC MYA-4620 / CBS 123657 / FGSC 9075 / NRRL 31084 / PH-1) TaxID=229533 RepID=A0A098DJH6_GIBZE|nr:unnamed protein product [Fusarium graminearum]CZS81902.1 unnamed protein product [Fusarium graminearum]
MTTIRYGSWSTPGFIPFKLVMTTDEIPINGDRVSLVDRAGSLDRYDINAIIETGLFLTTISVDEKTKRPEGCSHEPQRRYGGGPPPL